MKYRVLKKHGGQGGVRRRVGETHDIGAEEARVLERSGHIEPVKPKRKKDGKNRIY